MKRFICTLLIVVTMLSAFGFCAAAATPDISGGVLAELEKRVMNAVASCGSCDVSDLTIPATLENMDYILNKIIRSDPEAFHVTSMSATMGSDLIEIRPIYSMTKQQYTDRLAKMRKVRMQMVADLDHEGLTDVEKALVLHDRLALLVDYTTNYATREGEFENDVFTAYSALVNKTAVCEGYSYAYMYLLDAVGIDAIYCQSKAMNHGWNIVYIDGKAYHVDVTFDDPVGGGYGYVEHSYFLCSTAKFKSNMHHTNDYNTEPVDTTFDNALWNEHIGGFVHNDGALYYSDSYAAYKYDNGVKDIVFRSSEISFTFTGGQHMVTNNMLCAHNNYIFYNTATTIRRYNLFTGEDVVVHSITDANKYIGAVNVKDDSLFYWVYDLEGSVRRSVPLVDIIDPADSPVYMGDASLIFSDVVRGRWYNDAINYTYENNFISGMSQVEFGVGTQITRGQFITILARMAGVDTTNNKVSTKFLDVESGKYYTAAIKWASENGVVNGITETTFQPNTPIQRQQLCVMIVNFAKYMKTELKAAEDAINFVDAQAIANYAKTAVATCQMADIVNGYVNGSGFDFKPQSTATRAEAAQILYKFHKDFVSK